MDKKFNVLIVDNDLTIRFALAGLLEMEGYNVTTVENGLKAVDLIRQNDFDVAFFDVRMPEMNGVEALKAIKKFNNRVAVVMMTADSMNSLIEEAEKEGIFDCIIKPFETRKVLDIIKRVELKSSDDKEKVAVIWADVANLKTLQSEMFNNGYDVLVFQETNAFYDSKIDFKFVIFEPKSVDEFNILYSKTKEMGLKAKIIAVVDYRNSMIETMKKEGILFLRRPFNNADLFKIMRTCLVKSSKKDTEK